MNVFTPWWNLRDDVKNNKLSRGYVRDGLHLLLLGVGSSAVQHLEEIWRLGPHTCVNVSLQGEKKKTTTYIRYILQQILRKDANGHRLWCLITVCKRVISFSKHVHKSVCRVAHTDETHPSDMQKMALIRVHRRDEEPSGAYLALCNVHTDSRNLYDRSKSPLSRAFVWVHLWLDFLLWRRCLKVYGLFVACD